MLLSALKHGQVVSRPVGKVELTQCKTLRPYSFSRLILRGQRPLRASLRASRPTVCVLEVSEDTFETEVLKANVPVLVDFWATWCGPCKLVAPLMDYVEKEYNGGLKVVKVEADPNPAIIEKYKVYGLPTLILFKDGEEMEGSKHEGAISKSQLLKYLEKHELVSVPK